MTPRCVPRPCAVRHCSASASPSDALQFLAAPAGGVRPIGPWPRLALPNPVSADYGVMRDSLLPRLCSRWTQFRPPDRGARPVRDRRVFGREGERGLSRSRGWRSNCGPFGRGLWTAGGRRKREALLWLRGRRVTPGAFPRRRPALARADIPLRAGVGAGRRARRQTSADGTDPVRHPPCLAHARADGRVEMKLEPLLARSDTRVALRPVPPYPGVRRRPGAPRSGELEHGKIVDRSARPGPKSTDIRLFDILQSQGTKAWHAQLAYNPGVPVSRADATDDEVNTACRRTWRRSDQAGRGCGRRLSDGPWRMEFSVRHVKRNVNLPESRTGLHF